MMIEQMSIDSTPEPRLQRECPVCFGRRQSARGPCKGCAGTGWIDEHDPDADLPF